MPFDPDYAGEPVTLRVGNVRDDDGRELDDTNAAASILEIVDNDGTSVHGPADIPWEAAATPPGWVYVWDTSGVDPGDYIAQVAVTPSGSIPSWRFIDVHLEARPTAPLLPFGSTVDDVKALLPHRRWSPGTRPDVGDVERFLVSAGSVLNVCLVPPPADPAAATRLAFLARRAVVYGAAAQAEAAGTPERAKPNDPSSYAEWLQARYLEAVEVAEAFYDGLAAGEIPGAGDIDAEPAWAFPDPVGWAARGI